MRKLRQVALLVGVLLSIVLAVPVWADPPTLTLTGRSLTVTIDGTPGGVKDWLGLFLATAPDTAYLDWMRLNGTKSAPAKGLTSGTATFAIPLTGGPWEIRLLTSDGAGHYTRLAVVTTIALMP